MKNNFKHIVIAITLFFSSPILNFAQAPTLGSAAKFVIFSSTGAVGNTGTSFITGDVGTNTGAITIYVNVNGVIQNSNAATILCAADVLSAYQQLDAAPYTATHSPSLGNGDTLNAGIYSIAGNTTLDSVLTLNGGGDGNAVFILQIHGGTFSTTNTAQINLINGAQACNVFWSVDGSVSLVTGTDMKGTIIASNAAIDMGAGVKLEGRVLTSTAGAITANGVLAYLPTGCGSPVLTGPPAPSLASVACYGLFSGNGFLINTDSTYVGGDVGTNVGTATGYDSLKVSGTIHPGPDTSTSRCKDDLLNVYGYLSGLTPDIELLYPAQLGHNLVLTPHTYLLNAATSLTDTLFLNAAGNANAVFVMKIFGAFSTSVNSKIILTNGAQAKNVFWNVEGAVSINDSSVFKGTIVCNNGAISIKKGVALDGRALTTNGALNTAAIISTLDLSLCNLAPLPVSWLYFRGKNVQENVLLEWGTTSEVNNGFFTIEKSRDAVRFEKLTTVNTHGGTTNSERNYSFTDKLPYSISYYRISQTDNNGQKNTYRTIQVKMNAEQNLKSLNYVQGNYIYVQTSAPVAGNGSIELYNAEGKKMSSQKIILTKEANTYQINKPLNKGMYLISIQGNGGNIYHGKVMVQ